MKKDREKKQKYSNITDATIMGSTSEESALYASANRENLSVLDRLEEISKRKINPNYINQNINQQAGFSAELKEQAHANAQNILMENGERLVQYDNLSVDQKAQIRERFPDYATPSKNHEIVDYISVDEKGNVIPGTATQSKFVGRNGAECFKEFLSKNYEKYLKNGVKMEIPKDFFGDFQKEANIKIKSLESQIAKQKSFGDFQKAAKLEEKLQKCKIIKANTRSASITKEEAIYARNHPTLSTAKDVTNLSHQAGMNALGVGALVSGGVSLITNLLECVTKGKDPKKAIKHTAIATLKGGAYSYGVAFSSSLLGGMMQNSANKVIQSLGKSSAPAMIVGACVANFTIFGRYLSGKIDEVELCKQLGRTNTSLISGGAMAVAGQALIPIPVVGMLIGGFVGAALSEAFFNALNSKKVELARQRRIEIEKECRESIRLLEMYRNQFKEVFEQYFHETTKFFNQSFDELERALYAGDADLAIGVHNVISHSVSNFLDHFHRLKRSKITIEGINMQDIQRQVSDTRNLLNQLNANGIDGDSAPGVIAGCVGLGASGFTTGAILGGELAASGLAGMAVLGGVVAGPALAILGAISADEMEKKRDDAKAYYSQVKAAVKKADVMIDNLLAVERVVKLFTRQITKFDALFFSLSQDAIATMKKHNYNHSLYNQEERDQLCVAVSTLMTLSAFLKVPIIDKHQKLQEKAQRALEIMKKQMDSLESGHYDVAMIQSRQQDLENLLKDKGL